MWLLLLIFNVFTFAEDQSVEKYCFQDSTEVSEASNNLVPLFLPSEEIVKQGSCLVLKVKTHRRDFIQAYVLKNFPKAQVTFSDTQTKKEPCYLKVEKIKEKESEKIKLSTPQYLKADSSSTHQQETETMNIQTINYFELSVDQKQVSGYCRFITKNLYEIKITFNQNPKPSISTTLPPPNQNTNSISTEVQLNRGQRLEIGSLIKKAIINSKDISIKPYVNSDQSHELDKEKIYISLE